VGRAFASTALVGGVRRTAELATTALGRPRSAPRSIVGSDGPSLLATSSARLTVSRSDPAATTGSTRPPTGRLWRRFRGCAGAALAIAFLPDSAQPDGSRSARQALYAVSAAGHQERTRRGRQRAQVERQVQVGRADLAEEHRP
jgi:hypothetical protein